MSRPVNKKRPEELRNAVVQYLIQHGLADLSLRPLARALGCTPRVLLYHFGSKEKMVIEVVAQARRRQRAAFDQAEKPTFAQTYENIWKQISAPDSEPLFRLFFEIYGIALRHPRLYKDFLRATIEDWLPAIAGDLRRAGHPPSEARALATVVLAAFRGLMLDFCASHDRKRLDRAVKLWLRSLNAMLKTQKEAW
jgi:AcrR family transcriptional regulator